MPRLPLGSLSNLLAAEMMTAASANDPPRRGSVARRCSARLAMLQREAGGCCGTGTEKITASVIIGLRQRVVSMIRSRRALAILLAAGACSGSRHHPPRDTARNTADTCRRTVSDSDDATRSFGRAGAHRAPGWREPDDGLRVARAIILLRVNPDPD
jgi:hypothetical protein